MANVLVLQNTFKIAFTFWVFISTDGEVSAVTQAEEKRFWLDTNKPMETIQSFCPASICSINGTINHFNRRCCIPCDCSRTCNITGTDIKVDMKQPNADFIVEKCIKTSVAGLGAFIDDKDEYLLIQSCPTYELKGKNRETVGKCLQPNDRKLDEIMPVYSKTTGKNYRNVHCANCNEDYSVKAWRSRLTCPLIQLASLIPASANRGSQFLHQLRTSFLSEGCILKWEPAPGSASLCIDQSRVISSCRPGHYNFEKFRAVCLEIHAPVRVDQTIYKNVFCLACNEDINICIDTGNNWDTQFSVQLKTEVFAMTQINEAENTENIIGQCRSGMIYDGLLGQCIRKACPVMQVKAGDTCVSVIEKVSGTAFNYRLKLSYPKDTFIMPSDDAIFAAVRHLITHNNDRNIHGNLLSVVSEAEHIVIKVQMTKSVTNPTSLYDDFRMFKEKMIRINERVSNGDFTFTVESDDAQFRPAFTDYIYFTEYIDLKDNAWFNSIAMSNKLFCDMVIINKAMCEDNILYLENGITFQPGEYIHRVGKVDSIYICYDLYVSKLTKARSFASSSSPETPTVHVGLLVTTVIYMLRRVPVQDDEG